MLNNDPTHDVLCSCDLCAKRKKEWREAEESLAAARKTRQDPKR